jgi:hypothetical protein
MSVTPSPIGGFAAQFFDNNGQPLSGGKIYTYAAGTTTPQATYTSALGITPHSNPIILDSAGRVPGGEIWLTDGLVYKFKIDTATDVLIGTYDNITGVNSNFVNYTVQEEVQTATAGQTVFNLATINYTPATNSLSVYIDGVNQYVGDSYLETDSDTVTFTSGLHVGAEVKFTTAVQVATGTMDAEDVGYNPPFTGGAPTNVEIKLAQYVSVKDFGAVGDGVTNDRVAINNALAAGKRVYFPAGTYLVSGGSIELPDGVDGISMTGDGVSTKLTGGNSNGVILIQSHEGVYIADMWVESTLAAFGCISSFHQEISDVVIERCKFTTNGAILTNGIKMVMDNSTIGLDGMVIRDCVFDAPGRMGVEIQNNNSGDTVPRYRNVVIENSKFLRTGEAVGGGTAAGMGVSLTGEGENCEVIGNYFDQCTGPSIEIIGASRSVISGNFIRRPKARPIQVANTILMTDNIISENVVYEIDATLGGNVYLGSLKNSIISDNYFDLTNKSGVFVELTSATATGTGKNQFANNTVRTNASYALIIDGTPDNIVEGNVLDNSASGSNFATVRCNGAAAVRNAVFDNYVAKGTGGSIFDEASSATNNTFANFMSLESGAVYVRNANGGRNGFSNYDPPSIAAGGVATTTVTVTGAALGDYAEASFSLALGGLIIFAAVSAANTVTVTFYNPTGAPIDLGSGVLRARFTPASA